MNTNRTAPYLGESLSGTAQHVADLARTAGEKADEVRYETANALAGAASSVRTTGRQGSEAIEDLANNAASKLDSTAAYVRRHDVGDMLGNLRQVIRQHPASFLVGAAVVGFFLGSGVRRKDR